MKELFTKGFWEDVKATFEEARADRPPANEARWIPTDGLGALPHTPDSAAAMQTSLVPVFVYPISGAPLSMQITADHVDAEGVAITSSETEVVHRDSVGRLRYDLTHPTPELSKPGNVIQIVDPTSGFVALLIPLTRRAYRRTFPAYSPGALGSEVSFLRASGGTVAQEPGERTVSTEELGKRVIEGVEFEGKLTTVTIEGERRLESTDESWFSKELGIFGLKVTTNPGSKTTSRIQWVSRQEPDASLFVIPSDYVVEALPEVGA